MPYTVGIFLLEYTILYCQSAAMQQLLAFASISGEGGQVSAKYGAEGTVMLMSPKFLLVMCICVYGTVGARHKSVIVQICPEQRVNQRVNLEFIPSCRCFHNDRSSPLSLS